MTNPGEQFSRLTIPSGTSAGDFTQHVNVAARLTYLNPHARSWNYIQDEAGKTFEVMTHAFKRTVTSEEVRMFFGERGFCGNTAAFLAWIAEHALEGYHATIPPDDRLWCDPKSRELCAPYFHGDGGGRLLELRWVDRVWNGPWAFVAFREVQL